MGQEKAKINYNRRGNPSSRFRLCLAVYLYAFRLTQNLRPFLLLFHRGVYAFCEVFFFWGVEVSMVMIQ